MECKPLISIIVTVYNIGNWLPRCADSILMQTYKQIEVILVDDGSTDDSLSVIQEYTRKHPEVIKMAHLSHGGVTRARLVGVSIAKGEWIGFVDGDDWIDTDMYEILINNALETKSLISHCGYKQCHEDGTIRFFYDTGILITQDRIDGLRDLLEGTRVEPSLCNKLFHVSLFQGLSEKISMDQNIRYSEDLLMNYYLFEKSERSVFYDKCKYNYYVRKNSATRTSFEKERVENPYYVYKKILNMAPEEIKEVALMQYLNCCVRSYYSGLCNQKEILYEFANEVRNELIENKKNIKVMSRANRLRTILIIYIPKTYLHIEKLFIKYIQVKKYE